MGSLKLHFFTDMHEIIILYYTPENYSVYTLSIFLLSLMCMPASQFNRLYLDNDYIFLNVQRN